MKRRAGHLFAFLTVLIWGATFVAARTLIDAGLRPVEIIFYRFLLGWLFLLILRPRGFYLPRSLEALKKERFLILSGICLLPFYFLLEKTAVSYSTATNTSLLVAMSPLFIALISRFALKTAGIKKSFAFGALICLAGVFLVVSGGDFTFEINPFGDFLALGAGFASAVYTLLGERVSRDAHPEDRIIRMQRVFFYGLLALLPFMPLAGFRLEFGHVLQPNILLQLAYLGLAASALSFMFWNEALVRLGAVITGLYIYLIPVFTIIIAFIVLGEQLTLFPAIGAAMILCGLFVASRKRRAD